MKNNPLLIFTGMAVVAAVGLGAVIYSRMPGPETQAPPVAAVTEPATPEKPADVAAEKPAESAPAQQDAKTEPPAPEAAPAPETKPAETKPEVAANDKPTFDTVRVEPQGDTLAAGQATPGAEVTLKRNGEEVGKSLANADGDWVVVTETPLPKGASELSVEQKVSATAPAVISDQSIAVVVPEDPTKKAMVALVEPGMPTQVLQKAEVAVAATATEPAASATADTKTAVAEPSAEPEAKPAETAESEPSATAQPSTDEVAATAKTEEQPPAVATPEAPATVAETKQEGESPAPAEATPESKTALADPAAEPEAQEKPATEGQTPAVQAGLPVSLDAVDYNAAGDIVFSGSASPRSAVRVYVDNKAVGDAMADSAGIWTFAGTQQVSPGGHALRIDQIDGQGKVMSRVELPFVREEAARVAEITKPQATAEPQPEKTAEVSEPAVTAPEATVTPEQKPAATSESAATVTPETKSAATSDSAVAVAVPEPSAPEAKPAEAPESAAATVVPEPEVKPVEKSQSTVVAVTPEPSTPETNAAGTADAADAAVTPEPEAAPEQASPSQEPAAGQTEPSKQAEVSTEDAAGSEPVHVESESSAAAGTAETGPTDRPKTGKVVIQPGNNLWKLSRVIYGKGISFTVIYEANKEQIRNPDLIYPGQIFATPNAVPPESIDPKRREPLTADEGGATIQ